MTLIFISKFIYVLYLCTLIGLLQVVVDSYNQWVDEFLPRVFLLQLTVPFLVLVDPAVPLFVWI